MGVQELSAGYKKLQNMGDKASMHDVLEVMKHLPTHAPLNGWDLKLRDSVCRIAARRPEAQLRFLAAVYPFSGHELQIEIAENGNWSTRRKLAENRNLCATARSILQLDGDPRMVKLYKKIESNPRGPHPIEPF